MEIRKLFNFFSNLAVGPAKGPNKVRRNCDEKKAGFTNVCGWLQPVFLEKLLGLSDVHGRAVE